MSLIDKQFEFNLWANTQLIAICATLTEEQLMVESEGVFGRIQPTIVHMIQAESHYIRNLNGGTLIWPEDTDWATLSISDLLGMAQQSGEQLRTLANSVDPATRYEHVEEDGRTYILWAWTALAQALSHDGEHRTQLRILLTKLGVPHPDGSLWRFSEANYGGGFQS